MSPRIEGRSALAVAAACAIMIVVAAAPRGRACSIVADMGLTYLFSHEWSG